MNPFQQNEVFTAITQIRFEIRAIISQLNQTTKAVNKLIRKQEKLKNFIKEKNND